jgi:hypothetical protein
VFKRAELGPLIGRWLASLDGSVQVACDSSIDWELLVDVCDGELPINVRGRHDLGPALNSLTFRRGASEYHAKPGRPWHHALHDACAHREGWRLFAPETP